MARKDFRRQPQLTQDLQLAVLFENYSLHTESLIFHLAIAGGVPRVHCSPTTGS